MEELVKIHDHKGQKVVSARELHEYLGSKRDFSNWIKDKIEKFGFIENQDYVTFNKIVERAKRIEYAITLDMAKELSMVENNDKGRTARRYFIDKEKQLKQITALPDFNNPVAAARAWADEAEQKALAQATAKKFKDKADFADRVIDAGNMVDIGQAAKLLNLGFGRNTFFKKLREDKIFFNGRNEPKQQYTTNGGSGYFSLKEIEIPRDNHSPMAITKVLVTQKGLYWLSKRYGGDYHSGIPQLKIN